MKILAIGDIVGNCGCEYICKNLNKIRDKYKIDFVIANGENSATTNGITKEIADELITRGVDVITMGNHTFANKGAASVLDENHRVIRPLNYPPQTEGFGYTVQDLGFAKIGVINLIGRVDMPPADCPFRAAEKAISELEGNADIIIVDMHAEATSEKIALAHFLDGKAQIVFGTHTHVQTADERILPAGTGYITDLGMTGVEDSVLGVDKDIIINFFYNYGKRYRFEKAEGEVMFNGCIFEVDNNTKKTISLERLRFFEV